MNYEISIVEPKKYILLKANVDITTDIAYKFTKELADIADANSLYRFLCDVRNVKNTMSTYDNYQYAYKDVNDLGIRHNIRSAVLTSLGEKSHNFMETVAQNAGYIIRIFTEEAKAITWLMKTHQASRENQIAEQSTPIIAKPKFTECHEKKSV